MKENINNLLRLFLSYLLFCNFICFSDILPFSAADKAYKETSQESNFLHSIGSYVYSNNEKKNNRLSRAAYSFSFLIDKNVYRFHSYFIIYKNIPDDVHFNNFLQTQFATST